MRFKPLTQNLGKYSLAALTPELIAKYRNDRLAGRSQGRPTVLGLAEDIAKQSGYRQLRGPLSLSELLRGILRSLNNARAHRQESASAYAFDR